MSHLRAFWLALLAGINAGPVRLLYQAESLALGSVTSWPNQGSAGVGQALQAGRGTSAAPVCLSSGGPNGHRFVRFAGSDFLETPGLLGLSGTDEVGLVLIARIRDNANFVGWGVTDNGLMFDLYRSSAQVVLHNYGGGGPLTDTDTLTGEWQVLYVHNRTTGLQARLAGTDYTRSPQQQPANGTFRLGGGQWSPLNKVTQFDVAYCAIIDLSNFSAADEDVLLAQLQNAYQLPA